MQLWVCLKFHYSVTDVSTAGSSHTPWTSQTNLFASCQTVSAKTGQKSNPPMRRLVSLRCQRRLRLLLLVYDGGIV